ncbi:ATP-binding protein [Streptomyces sp. JV176]|uniref:ATP-binding protein n=1 Tax=Streptomyces sp. JV176 TaxID=858630 RepID=UPI002E79B333|nr:tetratricopeptide repeat protein [Streptomyces sp. JV176]
MQAGQVTGDIHFHGYDKGSHRGQSPRPRQLPADIRNFVNRAEQLQKLDTALSGVGGPAPPDDRRKLFDVSVHVIVGTAGSGKTSLALHWAHQVADRFPDGHLYANLRGYDPGAPLTAAELLPRFLIALGTPPDAVPPDPEAAAALYRSLLADRSMLIVLDNAATVAQVRPLLPGNARCLTVVTSRGRLSGLTIRDGADRLTLGTLAEPEAVALLRTITADHRSDDSYQLAELARLCARLPLALRIAAERASNQPHMRLDELIADLRDESALWDALSAGDEEESEAVRAVFAWSYRALPPAAARMFGLLGLHPGPWISAAAAAALAGVEVRRARQLLDTLMGAHLLEQKAPNRFEFHDLLRAYARDQVRREVSPEGRKDALLRLLEWYVHTSDAAQVWISPDEEHLVTDPPGDGVSPLVLADYDQAVDWSEQEQANFLPMVRAAEASGLDAHAWRLPAILWNAKAPSALTADWMAMGRIGLSASRRLGDRPAEAILLEDLGFAYTDINMLADSLSCHQAALEIRQEVNDRYGEANSLNALGLVHLRKRQLAGAEAPLEQASELFGELGETHWQAVSDTNLAQAHYQAGRLAEAAERLQRALSFHRRRGNARSIGNALWILSAIHLDRGEFQDALRTAEEAVRIALDLRSHVAEGWWLIALGNAHRALTRYGDALTAYQRSAMLHGRLGDRSREALAWQGAGETYALLGRPDEAVNFHRAAVAVHRELGDAWHEAIALEGLGAALRHAEAGTEGDTAGQHWTRALELLAAYDDPRAAATRERVALRLSEVT